MAGGVYNLFLGADEINQAVSGAYEALISEHGYTGDINVIGGAYFDFVNTEILALNGRLNVTGNAQIDGSLTGYGFCDLRHLNVTGNSFLANITGNAAFDQITATGDADLSSLINGINIAGGANIDGGVRNTGDFKNFGQFHVNDDVFITGDTTITGTLFINGTPITGENNLNITITGNGTGGFNFFEEQFQDFPSVQQRGTSLMYSTGVGSDNTTANPSNIDFSINAKGNGGYVINSPDVAGHRVIGSKAIDFQPERTDSSTQKTSAEKGITVGSNNVNLSKEGVIVGNENTLDIGDDDGGGDYSTYDFIGNFVGGRQNQFQNANEVNVIGANNTGTAFNSVGGIFDSSIIGRHNVVSGEHPVGISNVFIGGNENRISGNASFISGSSAIGYSNTVLKSNSTAIGANSLASRFGEISLSNGKFSENGDSQTSLFVSRCLTEDAVQTEVFLNNSDERIEVSSDSAMAFETLIVAKQQSSSNAAGYKISGVISNNAGTTALVGSITKTVLGESVASWDATIEADDTNDALVIKVTGTGGNDIRWVAMTTTSQVVF